MPPIENFNKFYNIYTSLTSHSDKTRLNLIPLEVKLWSIWQKIEGSQIQQRNKYENAWNVVVLDICTDNVSSEDPNIS